MRGTNARREAPIFPAHERHQLRDTRERSIPRAAVIRIEFESVPTARNLSSSNLTDWRTRSSVNPLSGLFREDSEPVRPTRGSSRASPTSSGSASRLSRASPSRRPWHWSGRLWPRSRSRNAGQPEPVDARSKTHLAVVGVRGRVLGVRDGQCSSASLESLGDEDPSIPSTVFHSSIAAQSSRVSTATVVGHTPLGSGPTQRPPTRNKPPPPAPLRVGFCTGSSVRVERAKRAQCPGNCLSVEPSSN
jgi:hypothetical protein